MEALPEAVMKEHNDFVPVKDNSLDKLDGDDKIDTTGGWIASITIVHNNTKLIRGYKASEKLLLFLAGKAGERELVGPADAGSDIGRG